MINDTLAMAIVITISVLLLLIFVKKEQVRKAFLALMVAQLFSWPITLLYVQFGLQENPVRLFPHATASNFLFAFMFHPSVFAAYYLHYPTKARKSRRILFSGLVVIFTIMFQFLTSLITNLAYFPNKLVLIGSFVMIFILYNISRIYIDWYLFRICHPERNEK